MVDPNTWAEKARPWLELLVIGAVVVYPAFQSGVAWFAIVKGERTWTALMLSSVPVILMSIAASLLLTYRKPLQANSLLWPVFVPKRLQGDRLLSGRWRRFPFFVMTIVFVCYGAFAWYFISDRLTTLRQIVVVVADFAKVGEARSGVTEQLLAELRRFAQRDKNLKIIALGKEITEQEGPDGARAVGGRFLADLVVWGWYDVYAKDAQVMSHVEVMAEEPEVPLRSGSWISTASIRGLERFALSESSAKTATHLLTLILATRYYFDNLVPKALELIGKRDIESDWAEEVTPRAQLHFFRGVCYLKVGEAGQAVVDLQKAADSKIPIGNVHFNLGLALFMVDRPKEAIQAFVSANEDENWQLLVIRGASRIKIGDKEGGLLDLKKALSLAPDQVGPLGGIGMYHISEQEWELAEESLTSALEIAQDPMLLYARATAREHMGKLMLAEEDFTACIRETVRFDRERPDLAAKVKLQLLEVYEGRLRVRDKQNDTSGILSDAASLVQLQPFKARPLEGLYWAAKRGQAKPETIFTEVADRFSNAPLDAAQKQFILGMVPFIQSMEPTKKGEHQALNVLAAKRFRLANDLAPGRIDIMRSLMIALASSTQYADALIVGREVVAHPDSTNADHTMLEHITKGLEAQRADN